MLKSKGVMLILETFWKGYTNAFSSLARSVGGLKGGICYLLPDENLFDSYARDDEVRIRLCDMIPHHLGC
jgi:hypothetical protein